MKTKITYKGPLALYVSYCVLLILSVSLIILTFPLDIEGMLFIQVLIAGLIGLLISGSLLLHYTQIEKTIDPLKWKKSSDKFHYDEGDFQYTFTGFKIDSWNSGPLNIKWEDITKIEAHQRKIHRQIQVMSIDLYFSEDNFITIDSSINGFSLFESRLRENLDNVWSGSLHSTTQKDKVLYSKKSINT